MVKKKRRVIETFEFKLKHKLEEKNFIKYIDKSQKFFEKQPGYEHRLITHDGVKWSDQIQWRNEDYAKDARKLSKRDENCIEFYDAINTKTSSTKMPELVKMY
jgi:hypothetical protein